MLLGVKLKEKSKNEAIGNSMRIIVRELVRNILLMLVCAMCVTIAYFEIAHRYDFGHFVPYGLHVDALNDDFNIAIPGQTKMYWAEISNFSLLPVRLPACGLGLCKLGKQSVRPSLNIVLIRLPKSRPLYPPTCCPVHR